MPALPFALQTHLEQIQAGQNRQFAFAAHTLEEFVPWQANLRARLTRLLGLENRPPAALSVETLGSIDRDACLEQKVSLAVGEGVRAPLYLLVPKRKPPYRAVLVFHGHDPSAQYCLGHYPDDETERANLEIDNNYAFALAEAGYLVCVVEQRGLGERLTEQVSVSNARSCRHLAFFYLLHGRTLLGERLWDGMCAASYLLSRPDVRGGLGCTGHSGGGTTALWLSALDERLSAVAVSGYFSSFQGSILSMEHCECNYVPGILALAEMGEIAALIAPRPFYALNGKLDPLFPAKSAVEQFETVRLAYALHNAVDACQLTFHPGAHAYNNEMAQAWFARWMK